MLLPHDTFGRAFDISIGAAQRKQMGILESLEYPLLEGRGQVICQFG